MNATTERADVAALQAEFGTAIQNVKEFCGDTFVSVSTNSIVKVLAFLKDHAELQYDYFSECVGVDYSTWKHERDWPSGAAKRFEVVYNLMSSKSYQRLFIKVTVDDGERVPTCMHVFSGAEYPEREIQDLFGVIFEGNGPTAGQRFLLPDDWVGYPLRKEYPLGGEDVLFAQGTRGPAVEDISMPHAGESFEGKTGSSNTSGR